jgi:hypothetical protein
MVCFQLRLAGTKGWPESLRNVGGGVGQIAAANTFRPVLQKLEGQRKGLLLTLSNLNSLKECEHSQKECHANPFQVRMNECVITPGKGRRKKSCRHADI